MRKYLEIEFLVALWIAAFWRVAYLYGIERAASSFIPVAVILLFVYFYRKRKSMKKRVIQKEAFYVIGIAVETTNKDGKSAKDLGKLWKQFYVEKVRNKIPENIRIGNEIYCIYTDYESNYRGKYTAIIGMKVTCLANIPNGLIGKHFNGGNYVKFISKGKMPEALINTWNEIWREDEKLNRNYTADFEVYSDSSQDGGTSEVSVYIAVK